MKRENGRPIKKKRMSRDELADKLTALQMPNVIATTEMLRGDELRDVLHELEVSQIELEVQNRELIESRISVEESHDKYLSLYDLAPVGYLTLDKLGTIIELNIAAARLLGVERKHLIGRLLSTKIQKSDLQKLRNHLHCCRDGENKVSETIHLVGPEHLVPIQLLSAPVFDRATGEFTIRSAMTDLTSQKKAEGEKQELLARVEASRNQLYDFFMQAPTAMVILEGPEYRFVLANPPYEAMIGRKAQGKTLAEVFPHGEVQEFLVLLNNVYHTGVPFNGKELPLDLPDEKGVVTRRWLDIGYQPFRSDNGEIKGVMAIHHDVTESVSSRCQIEEAKLVAERATNLKSAFLANMSHEIRTPLSAILGFTEIIKSSESKSERETLGTIVSRNGKALTRLIDDILDLSKVEAGKLELERIEFNAKTLVSEIAELFKEAAHKKNINLTVEVHPSVPNFVNSDPTRIRQILINLIGNAVKFTMKGFVLVRLEPLFSEDKSLNGLKFSVQDSGIGLSKEQVSRLFEPFSQADNSMTRKFGGSGLGLVLSRKLARALGGDVEAADFGTKQGCTFVAAIEAKEGHMESEDPAILKSLQNKYSRAHSISKVLLVEDSVDNQLLVRLLLKRVGISVDFANNGAEGVEMAEANEYDAVLMDMQMPVLDGYAATEQLRNDGYTKPIVALTAHAMLEDRTRILALGCDAHLTKPLDTRLLIETLNRLRSGMH